ncbi:MAG TPA: hypothetical protein V6C81_11770 [Planktothrix sp.]
MNKSSHVSHKPCSHRATEAVKVGDYSIYLGGTMYFQPGDVDNFDVLIPLTETGLPFGQMVKVTAPYALRKMPPLTPGRTYQVLPLPIVDFQGPPVGWGDILREKVVPLITSGKKVVAFCAGSHGRTGTLLASLIAIMEPRIKFPIQVARKRHCHHAVETVEQMEAIIRLMSR